MHYEFSEQDQKFIEETRRIVGAAMIGTTGMDLSDGRQARELARKLAVDLSATGYMAVGLDDDAPLGPAAMAAMEAFAAAAPQVFIPFEMSARSFGRLVRQYGTPRQREEILPELRKGSLTGAVALCEKTMNVVNDPLTVKGVRDGESVVVTGDKGFVINGNAADLLAVVGGLDDGLGVFLVDRQAPGVTISKAAVLGEYAPLHIGAVKLDNCVVPGNRVMGPFQGSRLLHDLRLWEDQMLIAAAAGQMSAALFDATAYAKEHRSGGKPVVAYQEVGFKLAEMLALTQTAQLMAYKAAWLAATGDREAETMTACAKVFCGDSAEEVAGGALRILSAGGLMPDNPAAVAGRYAKFIQIAGTSTEIARMNIGDAMLK
jgi:alkylation response protein AidB-like acyl-CoA dehydrogenase